MARSAALPYNGPMVAKDADRIYELVGRRIREERKARGLTQDFIASKVDLGASHFSNLESGKKPISLHTLFRVAGVFRIPVQTLFDSTPAPKPADDPSVRRITELVREASPKRRAAILKVVQTLASPD